MRARKFNNDELGALISGFNSMLDSSFGELNEIQKEYLNDVLESSRHLLSLINDILVLAKVESGKLTLEISDIDVGGGCLKAALIWSGKYP